MPVFGICFITWQTSITSLLQTKTEPAYLGRVMSLYTLAMFGTTPFGALISGWLIDHRSARYAMGMGLITLIPSAAWLWFANPLKAAKPDDQTSLLARSGVTDPV
jgi:MFS family permease